MRCLLTIMAASMLSACTAIRPMPKAPHLDVPVGWREVSPVPASGTVLPEQWWNDFGDPQLDTLVQGALEFGPDVRIALARVEQARAALRLARAEQKPVVRASTGATRQRVAEADAPGAAPQDPVKRTSTRLSLGLDMSYEVDLWGRLSKAAGAAVVDARASETDVQAVRLLVAAEVARQYVALAQADAQVQVQAETLAVAAERRVATVRLAEAGLVHAETLLEIDREIDQILGSKTRSERARAKAQHRLAALVGRAPTALRLTAIALSALRVPTVPADLPSTVLQRRPDLASSQARLRAASLRAEAARRARFPQFSLTAAGGFASDTLKRLARGDAVVWSTVAQLAAPLLGRGHIEGRVAAADADHLIAQESYRQAALNAFAEVEDALSAVAGATEAEDLARATLASRERSEALVSRQVAAGHVPRLNALAARAAVLSAREELARAYAERLLATIDLVRSLGGGFLQSSP